jgi:hypothetical protein
MVACIVRLGGRGGCPYVLGGRRYVLGWRRT